MAESHSSPDPTDHGNGQSNTNTMPNFFTTGTYATLPFAGWVTSTTTIYICTLIILLVLTLTHRLLGVLKLKLDKSHATHMAALSLEHPSSYRQRFTSKARPSPLPRFFNTAGPSRQSSDDEIALVSPDLEESRHGRLALDPVVSRESHGYILTGVRALVEVVRVFLGYVLMLAVMTLNIGIFCTILGSIFAAEVVIGRLFIFAQLDTGCHDG